MIRHSYVHGQCATKSEAAIAREPWCQVRIWRLVSETMLIAGSSPYAIHKHRAVPFFSQVEAASSHCWAEVERPANTLFLAVDALYFAHTLSLGMVLGLLV